MILHMKTGPQPTTITIYPGDARELDWLPAESIHLVVTSPPYWTLKEYPENESQLGRPETRDKDWCGSLLFWFSEIYGRVNY